MSDNVGFRSSDNRRSTAYFAFYVCIFLLWNGVICCLHFEKQSSRLCSCIAFPETFINSNISISKQKPRPLRAGC